MAAFVASSAGPGLRLAARFALRELRGGLSGFAIFIACIAIGVAAIASVGATTRAITEGLAAEGGVILGGDVSFSLAQRELTDAERAFLTAAGTLSEIAGLRAMARTADDNSAMIDIKAVDGAYPLVGEMRLEAGGTLADALAERNGRFGIAVDPLLLARLDLAAGDTVSIGRAEFRISDAIAAEPDRVAPASISAPG
ncbi:hypothetical protein A6302_02279 [Methylobrevis pamukkalensis]|uniref:Glycosyl transferase family 1 n=1 Tax=Methylobrevis pamukkalensis TaxID=1439726 RepID=A0A1E3H2N5_9HYPH|nr:hypothetical protein A6302_02279 [Methylobrevis pamukkalensis]